MFKRTKTKIQERQKTTKKNRNLKLTSKGFYTRKFLQIMKQQKRKKSKKDSKSSTIEKVCFQSLNSVENPISKTFEFSAYQFTPPPAPLNTNEYLMEYHAYDEHKDEQVQMLSINTFGTMLDLLNDSNSVNETWIYSWISEQQTKK